MITLIKTNLFKDFVEYSREDQLELVKQLVQYVADTAVLSLRPGQMVKFKTRNGVWIEGKIIRVNQKSIKITSRQDRQGSSSPDGRIISWSVSPSLVVPV